MPLNQPKRAITVGLLNQSNSMKFVAEVNAIWDKLKRTSTLNDEALTLLGYSKDKIDKAMFLSKWHRDNVPLLPEDKVMITANGINI